MAVFVYILTGPTKKAYIGVSKNPQERFKQHSLSPALIGKAIRKYGKQSFSLDILEEGLSYAEAYNLEQLYVKIGNTLVPNGYNLDSGGRGGMAPSKESKQKNSKSHLGKKLPKEIVDQRLKSKPERDEKLRQARELRTETRVCLHPKCTNTFRSFIHHSKKFCSVKCNNTYPKKTEMLSKLFEGRTYSPETIIKMSKAKLGIKPSLETIAKRVATNKRNGKLVGVKLSKETIRKRTETRRKNAVAKGKKY